jgi:hypothetical protein
MQAKIDKNGAGASGGRVTSEGQIEKGRAPSSIARLQKRNAPIVRKGTTEDLPAGTIGIAKIDIKEIDCVRSSARCRRLR